VFPAGAQEKHAGKKLLPVDEASGDHAWIAFRNRLLAALEKHDKKFLLSIVDHDIRNSFGGAHGLAEFNKQWDIDSKDSPLWHKLSAALFLGGAYVKRDNGPKEFCAPYVAAKWPDDVDRRDHGAIVSRDAFLKASPSSSAATVEILSYDIVTVVDWEVADLSADTIQRWVKIRLGAREGYVPEEQIRSPLEHEACFVRSANGWRMTALTTGGG